MYAAVLRAFNKPPRYEQFPEPVPGDGEVIVNVRAVSLKPIDKQLASGSHYAAHRELPFVCGIDGVGRLSDGQRVFFGGPRAPYGAMAERTPVLRAFCFPVPDGVSDETAAALPNPGVPPGFRFLIAQSCCREKACASSAPPELPASWP